MGRQAVQRFTLGFVLLPEKSLHADVRVWMYKTIKYLLYAYHPGCA